MLKISPNASKESQLSVLVHVKAFTTKVQYMSCNAFTLLTVFASIVK